MLVLDLKRLSTILHIDLYTSCSICYDMSPGILSCVSVCVRVYMQSLCCRLVRRIKQFRYVVCVINALEHPQQLSAEGRLLNAANITVCLFGGRHTALVHSPLSPIKLRCLPDIVSFFSFLFFLPPHNVVQSERMKFNVSVLPALLLPLVLIYRGNFILIINAKRNL